MANVTITESILTPLQCEGHPNGMQTLNVYQHVVCWNSDFDQQHQIMVGVACVAVLIPLAFLTLCFWVVLSLPLRFRQGDVAFLRAFAFLFHRYRPGAYWYAVAVLLRNTLVPLVPVIADEALQLFTMVLVLTPCAFLSCVLFPWRVYLANVLDIATNAGFLLILFLAALSTHKVDRGVVGACLLVLFTAVTALVVGVGTLALFLIFGQGGKSFQFFLCHHKIGGGGFARLLKVLLKSTSAVSRDVFLDADNLEDLALLFAHVGNQTETLIVLCTAEVMSRVWCVGEMTTARLHGVDVILVIFPDFRWPAAEAVENCAVYVDGLPSLAEYDISEAMVKETFNWLRGLPRILLPQQITRASMVAVVGRLTMRTSGKHERSPVEGVSSQVSSDQEAEFVQHQVSSIPDSAAASQVAALVDHSNQEAVCTAFLIQELLKAHFPLLDLVPYILTEQDDISSFTTTVLVICSNGCFQRKAFVRQLFQAASAEVGVITVVVEQNFRFPTEAFYAEVQQRSQVLANPLHTTDDLVLIIRKIFEEIAICVHPQDSEEAVKVRVAATFKILACRHGNAQMDNTLTQICFRLVLFVSMFS